MRTKEEIQKAHDELAALVLHEIDLGYPGESIARANYCLDVLCWVLRHDHNTAFQENLDELRKQAALRGYQLTTQKPH